MDEKLTNYNENKFLWEDAKSIQANPYVLQRSLEGFNSLLVFPSRPGDMSGHDYPLPFGYFASLVRMNDGKANIQITNVEDYKKENFKGYDLVAIYPMVSLLPETISLAEKIKNDYSETKVVLVNSDQHQHEMLLCNPDSKNYAQKIMERHKTLDYVLIGEAEDSFLKLCDKVHHKESDVTSVPSLLYKDGEEIKYSGGAIKTVSFTHLPFAARDYLEKGIDEDGINHISPRIQSSRGCVSPCLYCVESFVNIPKEDGRRTVVSGTMEKQIEEIDMLQKQYGVIFFNSIDSSFEDPGKRGIDRMKKFCDEIEKRNIEASFKVHMRAESVKKLEDSMIDRLKYVGVDILGVGSESGLQKELDAYRKIATPQDSLESILRLEKDRRFFVVVGHMMFTPVLTLDDLPEKVDFLNKIGHGWDYLEMSNNILIFPGTKYLGEIKERGLILEHDELSPTIPYRYEDERVALVADKMGELKVKFPAISQLNNKIYDSLNLISRWNNKMNRHLWDYEKPIREFKEKTEKTLDEVSKVQTEYFLDVVNSVKTGKDNATFGSKQKEVISRELESVTSGIQRLVDDYESKGLSTNKLILKTWMSLINTQVNTSRGKSGLKSLEFSDSNRE